LQSFLLQYPKAGKVVPGPLLHKSKAAHRLTATPRAAVKSGSQMYFQGVYLRRQIRRLAAFSASPAIAGKERRFAVCAVRINEC
jgi:hypothetical protein